MFYFFVKKLPYILNTFFISSRLSFMHNKSYRSLYIVGHYASITRLQRLMVK